MPKTHDLVIILGSEPDPKTWQFPSHVYASLDRAAAMLQAGNAPAIAVSGNQSINFDERGITQPMTESRMMADYLCSQGVAPEDIFCEEQSKDTVANLFYLKQEIVKTCQARALLFIVADFHRQRLEYLAEKLFGPDYSIAIVTVPSRPEEVYAHEAETLARTKHYFNAMQPGDDSFVKGMFYDHPFYVATWPSTG